MSDPKLLDRLHEEALHVLRATPVGRRTLEDISEAASLTEACFAVICAALESPRVPEVEWRHLCRHVATPDDEIAEDVERYLERDFTATSALDVVLFSNGFHARASHRVAHALRAAGEVLSARMLHTRCVQVFGADLHPGAVIGRRVFLDHGLGIVVGETAVVGDDCAIFQHVTLGSTAQSPGPRHPALGARVLVGAGAVILGSIEVGDDARIAPGAVVTRTIPPGGRA